MLLKIENFSEFLSKIKSQSVKKMKILKSKITDLLKKIKYIYIFDVKFQIFSMKLLVEYVDKVFLST